MRKLLILMVAVTFVAGFAASAMAQQALFYTSEEQLPVPPSKSLDIYGSVRVMTYIQDKDAQASATGFSDTDLVWNLDDGATRFGVRFKEGKIGANVEIRPRDRQSARSRFMSVGGLNDLMRHWYGSYDLGWGTFIVGQTWAPTFAPICAECLIGGGGYLDGYGDMGGTARAPGMQLHMPVQAVNGLAKIALLTPYTDPTGGAGTISNLTGTAVENDIKLPKIEASLAGAFGPLGFNVRGGYQTYDEVNAADSSTSVDSWLIAFSPTYSMGPLYFKGNIWYGQNYTVYGAGGPAVAFGLFPQMAGGSLQDVDDWGWMAVAGFRFNDMISIEAGYGERKSEVDVTGGTLEEDDSAIVIFLPITIAPNFVITPEVLLADGGKITGPAGNPLVNPDRGEQSFYGIYWRIDF
jgi:hypothetical protein